MTPAVLGAGCAHPENTAHCWTCPACRPDLLGERFGLIWVGGSFYPHPEDFTREAALQGVSRRIGAVPKGFKLGQTWALLAHRKAVKLADAPGVDAYGQLNWTKDGSAPGIFSAFKPERIELIVRESELTDELRADLRSRQITPVAVPDDDLDHQGSVFDQPEARV